MSKEVERQGYRYLEKYVREKLPGATLRSCANKGRGKSEGIGDAILTHGGKEFHIEIKALSKGLGTNIRFTHQTIYKACGHDLIVALICNLADRKNTSIKFFRLGSVQRVLVEPKFIVQQKEIKGHIAALPELLKVDPIAVDLCKLFESKVKDWIGEVSGRGRTV